MPAQLLAALYIKQVRDGVVAYAVKMVDRQPKIQRRLYRADHMRFGKIKIDRPPLAVTRICLLTFI